MIPKGKADHIIQTVTGCGPFQIIFVFLIYILNFGTSLFILYSNIFNIYSPGWKCLDYNNDNVNISLDKNNNSIININTTTNNISDDVVVDENVDETRNYSKDISRFLSRFPENETLFVNNENNCPLFKTCSNVQFDPCTSTLITEWGLLCEQVWVGPLILSLQMAGVLLGSVICGQLGDTIGRKPTTFGSQALVVILSLVSIFSNSWEMYAVLRFFLGVAFATNLSLYHVYACEFVPIKWRATLAAMPIASATGVFAGVMSMLLRDWRLLHSVTVVGATISFLPVFWTPESLRWLEVKNKKKRFVKVAEKMMRMNKVALSSLDDDILAFHVGNSDSEFVDEKKYTIVDLFRHGYGVYTVIIGFIWFLNSLWFFAINYGVKAMHGDFYINAITIAVCDLPGFVIPLFAPNLFGRKTGIFGFAFLVTACFLIATGFKLSTVVSLQTQGVTVLIMTANAAVTGCWAFTVTYTSEIYPTVIRSQGQNWGSLMARLGGIIAPFFIPTDPDVAYRPYAIMGSLGVFYLLIIFKLPETRGKTLKETFHDGEST